MEYPTVATVLAAQAAEAKKIFDATPEKPFMYVWRMEDASGRGPYRDPESWGGNMHGGPFDKNHPNHPEPHSDPGFTRQDNDTLNSLWGDVLFGFEKVPYAVKAYHITDGEYQVVFDVNTVKDLKEIKLQPKSKRGVPL